VAIYYVDRVCESGMYRQLMSRIVYYKDMWDPRASSGEEAGDIPV